MPRRSLLLFIFHRICPMRPGCVGHFRFYSPRGARRAFQRPLSVRRSACYSDHVMFTPPTAINVIRADRVVEVTWTPGHLARYPIRLLRLRCACAQCVNELTGEPILDPATVPDSIGIVALQAVGKYAVRFTYSDGHDTGIMTWQRLAELCPCPACRTQAEKSFATMPCPPRGQ
ncbi:MAG: hypothetical protein DCC65_03965 [Planctomycetota bacterium]|nr:MAG: hypothetical protein DCC65_03965 [Planctomycetota bacterium]